MEVFEAVQTVPAVRGYQDRPIAADVLTRIVEAGRLSASARNLQPWHFIVVQTRSTLQTIADLAKTGPYIAQAPVAIVVAAERNEFGVSDASRAIQNMVLTGWSLGIGSNWVGFAGRLEEVRAFLSLPDTLEVLAVLPFGYPATQPGKGGKKRKALAEVASSERYGTPFA